MTISCQKCCKIFPANQIDAKPVLTPSLWLIRLFRGQKFMLQYAADRGHDFSEMFCRECYGPGFVKGDATNDTEAATSSLFLNHYHCDACDIEWDDEWSCACNDHCPSCNAEIEPYESEDVEVDA
jgi:hypothetical protein